MGDRRVASVCFTGSVSGGRAVVAATASGFATSGLELGGKDPAYVRSDANLAHAIDTLTDGAFYNAGQSCCGIKRIYVAASRYEEFVAGVVDLTKKYRLGSPLDPETTIGPVVRTAAAESVRSQVREAVGQGARQLIDEAWFAASAPGTPYLAPQVLVGVDHSMAIMRDETFGPAVGIMKVASDEEAVRLMNDSDFGLTAAIFSADAARAEALGDALETGTVFLNRCDYLDPALAWTGVKNSGRGCTLSRVGFEQLTRPKSYHFRLAT
jgi:acyl-CoA reductase-like NAD-dependent aldehyde dehydrogenase